MNENFNLTRDKILTKKFTPNVKGYNPDEVDDFMTVENFRFDGGKLPLNTSGGNLAECYMHGLELITEAVRQVRGTSTAQVPNVDISMVCSGPMVQPVSDLILRA